MNLWKYVSVREDVFDSSLDVAVAPSLSEVVFGEAHRMYVDPDEFISITYPTDTIRKLVSEIVDAFTAGAGKVIVLPSTFGGGKTHAMILLYHLARRPDLLSKILGEQAGSRYHALEGVNVVVIDGHDKRTAPSPLPQEVLEEGGAKVRTLWGYLAYKLNAYDKVKDYDEMLVSPEKETLSKVLSDKKVLILIDELGIYYNRLARAPQPEVAEMLRRYADQVVTFLRVLSESVGRSRAVIVMSIPAEPTERGLEAEPGYEEFVERVEREVSRTAIRAEKPIATNEDFANVLRRRLFKGVDLGGAQLARRRLGSLYTDFPGLTKDVSRDVERYYPFHPLFVEVLREVVERNKDLQKTRDALRIARKVVRNLYGKVQELSLIMPTDIDVRVEEIRTKIITERYSGFDLVVSKIVGKVKEVPVEEGVNPEVYRDLAYRLALYVFLRTYVYDPHLEPKSEFPSGSEVVTGVYDPLRYEQYLISPATASELLDRLCSGSIEYRVPHLYGRDGYYWVTRLLDVRELVEKEAEKIEKASAENYILREVEALYTRPYEGREQVKPGVLSSRPIVLSRPELVEDDLRSYMLVVVVPPLKDLSEGTYISGAIYDIVYYKLSGRQKAMRRYANTVVVLLSNSADKWEEIVRTAKMILACEKLKESIKREYRDEKVVRILRDELEDMRASLVKSLKYKLIAQYFNLIAYPTVEGDVRVVRVERVTAAGRTLVELVEEALKSLGKVLEEKYSERFDVVASYLEGPSKEVRWTRSMKVASIVDSFFENPLLPMIPPHKVRTALRSGLDELKVGVIRNGKVFFKRIEGAETVSELNDEDLVVPPEEAAEKQIEELSKVEEVVEGDLIVRRYYVATYEGVEIPVRELKSRYPDSYIKVFTGSEIRLREERLRHGFDLRVEPQQQELRLGEAPEQVDVKVVVERVGAFEREVELKPGVGKVLPEKGLPDFEATWTITVPKEPGEYTYRLIAKSADLTKSAEVKLIVRRGLLCSSELPEKVLEVRMKGDVEVQALASFLVTISKNVKGLKLVRECRMEVEFREKKPEEPEKFIGVQLKNLTVDDAVRVARALVGVFGVTASVKCKELYLEVVGEGRIENRAEVLAADSSLRQKQVAITYCW